MSDKTPITPKKRNSREQELASATSVLIPDGFPIPEIAFQPIDVKARTQSERATLLNGPKVSIVAPGNIVIRKGVPKRAIIASSSTANSYFRANPLASHFVIRESFDMRSLKRLIDTMTTAKGIGQEECASLPMGTNFAEGVLIYQAANVLGVFAAGKAIRANLCEHISTRLLSYDELNTIINRVSISDPLFRYLANNLCYRRFKKQIPDLGNFETWLSKDKRINLQRAMIDIDMRHKAERAARRDQQISAAMEWEVNVESEPIV